MLMYFLLSCEKIIHQSVFREKPKCYVLYKFWSIALMLSPLLELRLSHTRENNQQVNRSLWTADMLNHLSYFLSERKHFPFWSPVFTSLSSPGIFGCGPHGSRRPLIPWACTQVHRAGNAVKHAGNSSRWPFSANQGDLAVGAVCSKNSEECIGLSFVFVVSHKGHQELWEALKQFFRSFFIFILHPECSGSVLCCILLHFDCHPACSVLCLLLFIQIIVSY